MSKKFALIVAGGSGTRMNQELPKQFIELNGLPVLMHTVRRFLDYDPEIKIYLILPATQIRLWKELCLKYRFTPSVILGEGGKERFYSVRNGLDLIKEDDGIVFIHDGVRPLVSGGTIQRCYETAIAHGNALPVIPVNESLRFRDDQDNKAVDRSSYVMVQTPQTFQLKAIKKAYRQDYTPQFTDDASVAENAGHQIHLVEGNRENVKITWPEDLKWASLLLPSL